MPGYRIFSKKAMEVQSIRLCATVISRQHSLFQTVLFFLCLHFHITRCHFILCGNNISFFMSHPICHGCEFIQYLNVSLFLCFHWGRERERERKASRANIYGPFSAGPTTEFDFASANWVHLDILSCAQVNSSSNIKWLLLCVVFSSAWCVLYFITNNFLLRTLFRLGFWHVGWHVVLDEQMSMPRNGRIDLNSMWVGAL